MNQGAGDNDGDVSFASTSVRLNAPSSITAGDAMRADFAMYRTELDSHYDRRDRLAKLSRDITALSKKTIFALHRITSRDRALVFKEADVKLSEIKLLFQKIQQELEGQEFWRYDWCVSPGIQEYLEALTFYHYLRYHTLPNLQWCQNTLPPPSSATSTSAPATSSSSSNASTSANTFPPAVVGAHVSVDEILSASPPSQTPYDGKLDSTMSVSPASVKKTAETPISDGLIITVGDYLGGIADLTGELMRLAIGSVGANLGASSAPKAANPTSTPTDGEVAEGQELQQGNLVLKTSLPSIEDICGVVREIKGQMDPLGPMVRGLDRKMLVLEQSLGKIESASYALKIRAAEYAGNPEMLKLFASRLSQE